MSMEMLRLRPEQVAGYEQGMGLPAPGAIVDAIEATAPGTGRSDRYELSWWLLVSPPAIGEELEPIRRHSPTHRYYRGRYQLALIESDGTLVFAPAPGEGRGGTEPDWNYAPHRTVTTAVVAQRLGISRQRVAQLARSLGIGAHIGRDWLFAEDDIAAMRERNTRPTGRPPRRTA